jgi:8-oxo-dGTP diphosphatase
MDERRPKVGIGVIIFKEGKVLAGKRRNSHGSGDYAWPGGHLEYMESFEDCARREVKEETGMEIENVRFLRLYNFKDYAPKHYVDIALVCDWKSGEPEVKEPEKVESWNWYAMDELPEPLFKACVISVDALKTGRNYYDS